MVQLYLFFFFCSFVSFVRSFFRLFNILFVKVHTIRIVLTIYLGNNTTIQYKKKEDKKQKQNGVYNFFCSLLSNGIRIISLQIFFNICFFFGFGFSLVLGRPTQNDRQTYVRTYVHIVNFRASRHFGAIFSSSSHLVWFAVFLSLSLAYSWLIHFRMVARRWANKQHHKAHHRDTHFEKFTFFSHGSSTAHRLRCCCWSSSHWLLSLAANG